MTAFHQLDGDIGQFRNVLATADVAAAVKIRADTDVIHTDDFNHVLDMVDRVLNSRSFGRIFLIDFTVFSTVFLALLRTFYLRHWSVSFLQRFERRFSFRQRFEGFQVFT